MAVLAVVALIAPLRSWPGPAPARAATPVGAGPISAAPIRGMVDAHAHLAASQAFGGALRCGAPFAPGGMAEALADCPSHSGTGHFSLLESILGGTADRPELERQLMGGAEAWAADWEHARSSAG